MKTNSSKSKVDPKLHLRKKTAGLATGAILGATVAGPIGALVGGAIGTFVGDAAERGARLPKAITSRVPKTSLRNMPRSKMRSKASGSSAKSKNTARRTKKVAASPRTKKKK